MALSYAALPIRLPTSVGWTIEILCEPMMSGNNYLCLLVDAHTTGGDQGIKIAMNNNDVSIRPG